MADIFVSYKREDTPSVEPLVNLFQRQGWGVWWDPTILPGERFATVIGAELDRASCVLVAWSRLSISSDWVRDEAQAGLDRNILVAVSLDGTRPPLGFRQIQTEDLSQWIGDPQDPRVSRLVAGVARLIPSADAASPADPRQQRPGRVNKPNMQTRHKRAAAIFTIRIGGEKLMPVVWERADLDGIAAARKASDSGTFATNQEYVQFVMEKWLEPHGTIAAAMLDHNKHHSEDQVFSSQELVQAVMDRAVRSYRKQHGIKAKQQQVKEQEQTRKEKGDGAHEQPNQEHPRREQGFDFIRVESKKEKSVPVFLYTLGTKGLRYVVHAQQMQSQLLPDLVRTASNDHNPDRQIGRTLFDLLIPVEIKAAMVGSGEMQIELDPQTAHIPWELLDTRDSDATDDRPWAIRVKLLRKLHFQSLRDEVFDAGAGANVLVIGEPECSPEYPRLFGARREAVAVQTKLTEPSGMEPATVKTVISADPSMVGADARTIINALFERPWRIVHIAGHGAVTEKGRALVVLSNGTSLGPDEIRSLRVVPELMFVNCCHFASADPGQLLRPLYDRAAFASSLAGSLIDVGVRCVIAAGWAVDDDAASIFAETFYGSLLRGNRFIDAVAEARLQSYTHRPQVNTWAAYQCYGDPNWVFRRKAADPNKERC